MIISVVLNCDTRPGYLTSTLGEGRGKASLHGVRSVDFLTEGVKQKIKFFNGYDVQLILYIDMHEDIPEETFKEIMEIVESCGNNSKIAFKRHDRIGHRWNDYLYIEALKLADGTHIAHFDQDANAYRKDNSDILDFYLYSLDDGYKFICQPTDMTLEEHGMFWASTRFFICKKETLNLDEISANLKTPLRGKHTPCFEHVAAVLAGENSVLYPPRKDSEYIVFSWATYRSGTLKRLNELSYDGVIEYIIDECGIFGPNDVVDK